MKPTPYTVDDERKALLDHLSALIDHWERSGKDDGVVIPGVNDTDLARMQGLVHSILVTFDGGSGFRPAMDLTMAPHRDDKAYHLSKGERWHKPGLLINDCQLHDLWSAMHRKP